MQLKSLILASVVTAVAFAQTSTTCAAQNILDACVSQTKGQLIACQSTDWDCQCTAWGVILTCYNNCPSDPGVFGVQQSRDQFCAAASAYGTKTASKTATATAAAVTSATAVSLTAASSTTASATAKASGNAASNIQVGGGVMAMALLGLGLLA